MIQYIRDVIFTIIKIIAFIILIIFLILYFIWFIIWDWYNHAKERLERIINDLIKPKIFYK